jgi:hypothetical protein
MTMLDKIGRLFLLQENDEGAVALLACNTLLLTGLFSHGLHGIGLCAS